MKRLNALFVAFVIGSIWASPACKSNEVNQEENTNNTYKSIVGPAGRTFENPEGVKIRIPAGALDEEVEVSITEAAAGSFPPTEYSAGEMGTASWTPAGKVWAFEPHGLKFFVESTMWLPAPPGDYYVFKSQPGGTWELLPFKGSSVGGKVEFTTKSFSFYALRKFEPFVPNGDASVPPKTGPCEDCLIECEKRCTDAPCRDACRTTDCAGPCSAPPDADPGKADSSPGTTDTSVGDTMTCTPMCPPSPAGPGAPCTFCGGAPLPCTVSSGPSTWNCMCDATGTLQACTPAGGSDSGTDTSGGDADACAVCSGGTFPLRPGESGTPCCKSFATDTECITLGGAPLKNSCSGSQWICRNGGAGCF